MVCAKLERLVALDRDCAFGMPGAPAGLYPQPGLDPPALSRQCSYQLADVQTRRSFGTDQSCHFEALQIPMSRFLILEPVDFGIHSRAFPSEAADPSLYYRLIC